MVVVGVAVVGGLMRPTELGVLRPPELGVVRPPEVDVLCPPEIGVLDPLELGVTCLVVPSSLGMLPVAALVFCLAVVSLGML